MTCWMYLRGCLDDRPESFAAEPAEVTRACKNKTAIPEYQLTWKNLTFYDAGSCYAEMKRDSNSPTLEALMQAAQAGNMRAYERLLREITPKLRLIVRRRRQFFTAEEVEDQVQEILLSIHAVRATYDPDRPFMPWLSTIAHNRLIDSARRFYRGKSNEVQMDELPVTFADDWTNIENEEYRDPEELSIAIKSLPEGQRKAIEMLKLREMSLKEAAASSGTTIGALKISIHRAVLNLRKALSKE